MKQKIRSVIILTLTLSTLAGCKKEVLEPCNAGKVDYRKLIIRRGNHYSLDHFISPFEKKESISFHGMFDDSAKYDKQDPSVRGINKFYGYTDCDSLVHDNSARFGWEWYDNQLLIYSYTYNDSGPHNGQLMGAVPLNTDVIYKISNNGDHYDFEYSYKDNNCQTVTVQKSAPRGCTGSGEILKARLWPYFGGNETAPHDITVYIDEF